MANNDIREILSDLYQIGFLKRSRGAPKGSRVSVPPHRIGRHQLNLKTARIMISKNSPICIRQNR